MISMKVHLNAPTTSTLHKCRASRLSMPMPYLAIDHRLHTSLLSSSHTCLPVAGLGARLCLESRVKTYSEGAAPTYQVRATVCVCVCVCTRRERASSSRLVDATYSTSNHLTRSLSASSARNQRTAQASHNNVPDTHNHHHHHHHHQHQQHQHHDDDQPPEPKSWPSRTRACATRHAASSGRNASRV
jgi:ABC-type nickel/cobalt efflux system permease component RcnA